MPIVRLYANLRNLIGIKEIAVPGTTVREVVDKMVQDYPQLAPVLLQQAGLSPQIIITLNGMHVLDLTVSTSERDIIAIFPPIAGG